ncbi:MAG: shikimate dehydrogenase [Maledivibacter sp.]|jgi:shikimate dehydrogenase|nr:shikimate dehydrogenase [Maledivibacter sp.]
MSGLFGLIGEKLKHSFSPAIHSIIFKELNMEGYYHLLEIEKGNLRDAVYRLKAVGAKGVNVTIPYKVDIMEYLDMVSDEGKKIGAVNTICFRENKAIGYNTDYFGFGIMLDKFDIHIKNKNAVILGTGGASKAVLQYLLDGDVMDVTFVTRDITKGREKFKDHRMISYNDIKALSHQDIIINCTPCGMYPKIEACPVSKEDISKFEAAVDLIYNPIETLFLKNASKQGIKAVNGLYMLVGQAVKAEELWNDIKIDDKVIEKIYHSILKAVI